jgi:peroxiredoxin Q/BCP
MKLLTLLAVTVSLLLGNRIIAEELKVGDAAPVFEAKDDDGKAYKSDAVVGKKIVVVYFYPADFTGGCTKQACGFRDNFKSFKDVEVLGISGDSVEGHKLFKSHHKLPFTLLADEQGVIAKKFGVPVNKGGTSKGIDADGKEVVIKQGVRISRWTFVIGKDGKIAYIDKKVNAAEDNKKVAEEVAKLSK